MDPMKVPPRSPPPGEGQSSPRALAKEQYQRRRTQARIENFRLRPEQRATPVLFTNLAAWWMTDHAKVMRNEKPESRATLRFSWAKDGGRYWT